MVLGYVFRSWILAGFARKFLGSFEKFQASALFGMFILAKTVREHVSASSARLGSAREPSLSTVSF